MVRIPSEYQEVEYIESTGKQWIDTGIVGREGLKFTSKLELTGNHKGTPLFGSYGNGKRCYGLFVTSGGYFSYSYISTKNSSIKANLNTIYETVIDFTRGNQSMSINENVYSYADNGALNTGYSMYLFGYNFSGRYDSAYPVYMKLYSFAIRDETDTLARNFIPCYRKSDNEIGMYDTVTKTFFTNQGTSTFLKGNDVNYDTVNLMESRRRILLNTPHLESLTGSALSFKTDMASKLKECKIHFTPIQEGSGDPSPDNIRPIRGYDSITIYNGQTAVATIPFPQTIYGGYVDLVKGEVVEEYKDYDMGDLDWTEDTTAHLFQYTFTVMPVNENNTLMTTYCEGYHPTYNRSLGTIRRVIGNYAIMGRNLYKSLWFRDDSYSTGAEFKQSNTGKHIVVPLEIPNSYSLDPVTIRTLRGLNNIWSDANGNIEIKYWTH